MAIIIIESGAEVPEFIAAALAEDPAPDIFVAFASDPQLFGRVTRVHVAGDQVGLSYQPPAAPGQAWQPVADVVAYKIGADGEPVQIAASEPTADDAAAGKGKKTKK